MEKLCGLPRANALVHLAATIYADCATIDGRVVPPWESLAFNEKHPFVTLAEVVVGAVRPSSPYFDLACQLSRDAASQARVIGTITPATPWGDLLIDGRD